MMMPSSRLNRLTKCAATSSRCNSPGRYIGSERRSPPANSAVSAPRASAAARLTRSARSVAEPPRVVPPSPSTNGRSFFIAALRLAGNHPSRLGRRRLVADRAQIADALFESRNHFGPEAFHGLEDLRLRETGDRHEQADVTRRQGIDIACKAFRNRVRVTDGQPPGDLLQIGLDRK